MKDAPGSEAGAREVRLWDPLTRLLHWALAVAVVTAWGLGEFGPAIMTLHFWAGYAVLAILALRLVWGIVGPRPARFASFAYGPRAVWAYLRGSFFRRAPSRWPGHNPMGAWAVFAMFALLLAQAIAGLLSDPDDYINVGPLAHLVSEETAFAANAWHATLSRWILALVLLHLAAIAYYRLWKREDLASAMIHGRKTVGEREG